MKTVGIPEATASFYLWTNIYNCARIFPHVSLTQMIAEDWLDPV